MLKGGRVDLDDGLLGAHRVVDEEDDDDDDDMFEDLFDKCVELNVGAHSTTSELRACLDLVNAALEEESAAVRGLLDQYDAVKPVLGPVSNSARSNGNGNGGGGGGGGGGKRPLDDREKQVAKMIKDMEDAAKGTITDDCEALALYLRLRMEFGLLNGDPGPYGARMRAVQKTLFNGLLGTWKDYEPPGVDLGLDDRQKGVIAAMMAVGSRADVLSAFVEKRRTQVSTRLLLYSQIPKFEDVNARIVEVLYAIGHVEKCFKNILSAIEADLPFLLGRGTSTTPALLSLFDTKKIARVMAHGYLPAFQLEASRALQRISMASAKAVEDDPNGFNVRFFDKDESERPRYDEELLVLRVDVEDRATRPMSPEGPTSPTANGSLDTSVTADERRADLSSSTDPATKVVSLRWCPAKVLSQASDGMEEDLQSTQSLGNDQLLIQFLDGGDRMPLRGLYFIQHSTFDPQRFKPVLYRRVLCRPDGQRYYQEGTIVKAQEERGRYCVQLLGTTHGKWVGVDSLLPGPLWKIRSWQFVAPVLRCLLDLPRRVMRMILLPHDPRRQSAEASSSSTRPQLSRPPSSFSILGPSDPRRASITPLAGSSYNFTGTNLSSNAKVRPGSASASTVPQQQQTTRRHSSFSTTASVNVEGVLARGNSFFSGSGAGGLLSSGGLGGGMGGVNNMQNKQVYRTQTSSNLLAQQQQAAANADLSSLMLEHDLDRHMTLQWMAGLADLAEDIGPHLLTQMSQVFNLHLRVSTIDEPVQRQTGRAALPYQAWVRALGPVFRDLSSLVTMCFMGSHVGMQAELQAWGGRPMGLTRSRSSVNLSMARTNNTVKVSPGTPTRASGGSAGFTQSPQRTRSVSMEDPRGARAEPSDAGVQEEVPRRYAQVSFNACNCFQLELKHLFAGLRRAVSANVRYPSDTRLFAEMLAFASFVRRTWATVVDRLELLLATYDVDEASLRQVLPVIWKITGLIQDFTGGLVDRGLTLVMHWCRAYFFQEVRNQDWDEALHPFMENRRCSYGIQAWSLFLRGLIFDFKPALYSNFTGSEARCLLGNILAQSLKSLTAVYLGLSPTRARLPQYISDMGMMVVTALMIMKYLKTPPSHKSAAPAELAAWATEELPMANYRLLETTLVTHDAGHQTALMALRVVERQCWALLNLLTLLSAPVEVISWYLRGFKGPAGEPPSPARTSYLADVERLRVDDIEAVIASVSIEDVLDSYSMHIELKESFNPISENQRIGSDRDVDEVDEASTHGTARLSDGSMGRKSKGMFKTKSFFMQEAYVGKKGLEHLTLYWRAVLANAPPFTKRQIIEFLLRRSELSNAKHPPLDEEAITRRELLVAEIEAFQAAGRPMGSTASPTTPKKKRALEEGMTGSEDLERMSSEQRRLSSPKGDGYERQYSAPMAVSLDQWSSPKHAKKASPVDTKPRGTPPREMSAKKVVSSPSMSCGSSDEEDVEEVVGVFAAPADSGAKAMGGGRIGVGGAKVLPPVRVGSVKAKVAVAGAMNTHSGGAVAPAKHTHFAEEGGDVVKIADDDLDALLGVQQRPSVTLKGTGTKRK